MGGKKLFHMEKIPLSLTASSPIIYLVSILEGTVLNVKGASERTLKVLTPTLKKLTF